MIQSNFKISIKFNNVIKIETILNVSNDEEHFQEVINE